MGPISMLVDPVVAGAFGGAASVILVAGALAKLRDVKLFRYAVENYGLLGRQGSALFAGLFPVTELLAGITILFDGTRSVGLLLSLGVLAVASLGVVINLLRGRTAIECGCGTRGQRISWGLVVRNSVLATAIVLSSGQAVFRNLSVIDYFSVAGAVLGLLALYACANELLANQPLLKEMQS